MEGEPIFYYEANIPYLETITKEPHPQSVYSHSLKALATCDIEAKHADTKEELKKAAMDPLIQLTIAKHWESICRKFTGLMNSSPEGSAEMVDINPNLATLFESIHETTCVKHVHTGWSFGHGLIELSDHTDIRIMCWHIQQKYPLVAILFGISKYMF